MINEFVHFFNEASVSSFFCYNFQFVERIYLISSTSYKKDGSFRLSVYHFVRKRVVVSNGLMMVATDLSLLED